MILLQLLKFYSQLVVIVQIFVRVLYNCLQPFLRFAYIERIKNIDLFLDTLQNVMEPFMFFSFPFLYSFGNVDNITNFVFGEQRITFLLSRRILLVVFFSITLFHSVRRNSAFFFLSVFLELMVFCSINIILNFLYNNFASVFWKVLSITRLLINL